MDMENTEDRTDGSLTPVHTGSHGEHMPETVPLGVLSNFTLPHTQDEDGHPQRSSSHMVTVAYGFSHTGTVSHFSDSIT